MTEKEPLVSICIPTYNRATMVGQAIESALQQSYPNIEVIVVDNASSDDTDKVVYSYQDSRLRYLKNQKNLGIFGNFNRCVELATGKYVHILHSDDFIDPDFTRTCIQLLEENPRVAMTFGAALILHDGTQKMINAFGQTKIFSAPEGFRQILLNRNFIICPTVILRRDVYAAVGHYSCEYPYAADLHLWLKITKNYDIAYIGNATLFYRQGEHSESFQQLFKSPSGYLDIIKIFIRMIDELGDEHVLYRQELNIALRRHLRDCLFAGITRSKYMKGYTPSVFFGYAITIWSLFRPHSISGYINKGTDLVLILCLWCGTLIPGLRHCISVLVQKNKAFY